MPPVSSKPSISLGELAICEDILDGHREYAINLLSNLEHIRKWHKPDGCSETHEVRTCTLCELCSPRGLMGTTTMALAAYDDVEKQLTAVRVSLGKSIRSSSTSAATCLADRNSRYLLRAGAPSRETLFKNSLAKVVFLSIVTAGDTLRSQHTTWQARLHSEISSSLSFAESPEHADAGLDELDKNRLGVALLPTFSAPKVVRPEANSILGAASTGSLPTSTSSSSLFVVVRRCLFSDCPCEANGASAATNTKSRGGSVSQVAAKVPPLSHTDPNRKRRCKATAKSEAISNHTTRSTTTNLERRPRKTSDALDVLAKTNIQTQKPSMYHDLNRPDARVPETPRPEDAVFKENVPSSPPSETESSLSSTERGMSIVDPRVFDLRAQIARSDDACRALMEWCRSCMADLHLGPVEAHKTGPDSETRGYCPLETNKPGKLPATSPVEMPTSGDDVTMVQALRFSEQEELEARWLTARQVRCKDRDKRRPSGVNCC